MLTKPIESSLSTVSNVKNVTSVSSENSSMVMVEFNDGTNMDSAMIELRENLGMIEPYLPEGANKPIIMKLNPNMMPVMSIAVGVKDLNKVESTLLVQNELLPRIERIEGVGQASLTGASKNEISIMLNEDKITEKNNEMNDLLQQEMVKQLIENGMSETMAENTQLPDSAKVDFNLSSELINGLLQGQNFSMPAGYVTSNQIDYMVRIGDKLNSLNELNSLPIMKNDLMTITLSDIADIEIIDTAESAYTKVNGQDAIMISIQKQSDMATTDVVDAVHAQILKIEEEFKDVEITVLMDQGEYINLAVNSVTSNLLLGGVFAVIILFIFLRAFGPTLIVGLSIPISVMVTFILIYFSGITLNMISMSGLALGVGMLVDNSIVVIENIYRLRSRGVSRYDAAITGASQVAGAITASTLTTIAVFLPVLFIKGFTADIFKELALTISFSLIGSLVVALTLVPMLSSKLLKDVDSEKEERSLLTKVKKSYERALQFTLKRKALTIVTPILLLVISLFLGMSKGVEFFPASDQGQIVVTVALPEGAQEAEQYAYLDDIVNSFMSVEEIDTLGATIGSGMMGETSNEASIYIILKENRTRSTNEVAQQLRDKAETFEHDITISDQNSSMMMMASGISISVKGPDFNILETIANDLATLISEVEGTTEINNGIEKAAPEIKITVNREKSIANGLSNAQVFTATKDFITPNVQKSSLTISGYDFTVNIYEPVKEVKNDLEAIENLEIETPIGGTVLLKDVADVTYDTGYASINRDNQSRTLTVSAQLQTGYTMGNVGSLIEDKIKSYDLPDGYQIIIGGEQEQINEAMTQLMFALLAAILLVYMVMASQFESLKYPFIILLTVPLAITGGFLGLFLTNTPVSVVAMIGLIILTGVVVNNGIVIIDHINQLKEAGFTPIEAVVQGSKDRLRPIIMTALTTITALVPMALGIGDGAEMMAPMAITTIGGLIYATLLTLFVVPTIYLGIEKKAK
ncbi:MAG TPA: AcrB/AcrD/AcrF family protein [Firmicutes bacterium]|nr:AcrB/AcrD/AcrF family protein [Bacillota bacterium]